MNRNTSAFSKEVFQLTATWLQILQSLILCIAL